MKSEDPADDRRFPCTYFPAPERSIRIRLQERPIVFEYYDRLGSDMSNVERHCTYRQSLDYLRNHCDFIPAKGMNKICGGDVARLFEI